jgi:cell division protein FtsB
MSVVFDTFEVIKIDGIPAGNIVDVISNHAPRRAEVLAAFGAYCEQVKAQNDAELSAQVETLTTEKTQLTSDLATANATIATLNTQVADLEQQVVELTPPPAPLSITRYQCTTWLRGAAMLQPTQSVSDLIRVIVTDADQQLRALDRWELGTSVLRNDPMIETLGLVLGLSTEQLDAAFLIASQIQ